MPGRTNLFFLLLLISSVLNAQKPGDKVFSVFVDEYGCQWFGTDKGLLRKCGDIWKAYPVQSDSPGIVNDIEHQSTPSGSVLWIGTMNGIIRITYSPKAVLSATCFNSKTNSFLSDIINGITFDKYTSVFFATPAGIGILANATWKFITKIKDISDNKISSARANGDTIFFGTTGEGVARLVRSVDGYSGATSFVAPWSALAGNNITCVFVDSKGHQWFGSDKGLSRHTKPDAKEGWDDTYTEKLPDQYVTAIAEDKTGNIWVGTHGGLVRFGPGQPAVSTWTVSDGLPSAIINDISMDKDDSLWIGTNLGAAHFNGSGFSGIRTSDFAKDFPKFKRFVKQIRLNDPL
jgi:ligand-binding sensor domain-containing protein